MTIKFKETSEITGIFLNDEDVTDTIRGSDVTELVSDIADIKNVRIEINKGLRKMAEKNGGILEGRDIQTLVLPFADYKFFLIASPEIRAKRRLKDYKKLNIKKDFSNVLKDIIARDKRDKNRDFGALKKAEGTIIIDSSDMTLKEVLEKILFFLKKD